MKKYWSQDEIMYKFEKLSYRKKYEIMYEAISYMRQYNGRGTDECIIIAMGFEYYGDNMYTKS